MGVGHALVGPIGILALAGVSDEAVAGMTMGRRHLERLADWRSIDVGTRRPLHYNPCFQRGFDGPSSSSCTAGALRSKTMRSGPKRTLSRPSFREKR